MQRFRVKLLAGEGENKQVVATEIVEGFGKASRVAQELIANPKYRNLKRKSYEIEHIGGSSAPGPSHIAPPSAPLSGPEVIA